jgi:enoyl-CoA hydratase
MALIHVDTSAAVATLTLDDPARRNALTEPMVDEIVAAFDAFEASPDVRSVVVTGAAPAFCAGADLSHLGGAGGAGDGGARAGLRRIYEGFLRVSRCNLPTIAAVNGAAVGAGMNLALACDVRLAGASARFDTRFLQLGIHPGGGHTWMLERAVGPQAAAATVLFGEVLTAADAERVGLVWRTVPDEELADVARSLAERAGAAPRELLVRAKATLQRMPGVATHAEAVDVELDPQVWSIGQPEFQARLAALQERITSR